MVTVEEIEKIINNIINNVSIKCGHTVAEMHTMLGELSYDEQYNQLMEKGLLNPLEIDDFDYKTSRLKSLNNTLSELREQYDPNDDDIFGLKAQIMLTEERISGIEDELFMYGRRLIEGIKTKEVPQINKDNFVSDIQWGGNRGHNFEWETEQGELEKAQINAQRDSLGFNADNIFTEDGMHYNTDTYEGKSALAMDNYFNGDSQHINHTISHDGYMKALNNQQKTQMKSIDNLMERSPGLQQDTILYRGGHFDIHLREGDSFSFKGYTSTTFQRESSDVYKGSDGDEADMTYVIHAPKGTKGICGGDGNFNNNNWEHEYVLPRNTKMTVLSIDYETMTCEVVIEE